MKYLICFPQGGFNDMCQAMWISYSYCKKYNRTLIIDTRNTITFKDDIRNYFKFNDDIVYKEDIDILFEQLMNDKTITFFPSGIVRNNKYNIKTISDISRNIVWKKKLFYDNIPFTFNRHKEYIEDVIFMSIVNGGTFIFNLLDIISLSDELKSKILLNLNKLPLNYIGIHIRNTDYSSNLGEFFNKYKHVLYNDNVFLGTDSASTIDFFKGKILKLFHFSNIPKIKLQKGKGFHHDNKVISPKELIEDCISDFFILCLSKKYFYSCEQSGYSKNIEYIRLNDPKNKKIKRILSID